MQNAEMEQILALMNQYAAVLITLNERGVIRTYNSPVGDFAEWLVSQKLGLRLEKNSIVDKMNAAIEEYQHRADDLRAKRDWFLKYFGKYFDKKQEDEGVGF